MKRYYVDVYYRDGILFDSYGFNEPIEQLQFKLEYEKELPHMDYKLRTSEVADES